MADNMVKYIKEYGAVPFEKLGFTPVDNLVLAELAYCAADGADGRRTLGALLPEIKAGIRDGELLEALAGRERFCGIIPMEYVSRLDNDECKQFSATSYLLPDSTIYVSFRGTDGTLVGWKEDFNLAFATPVPAQLDAVAYLEDVAGRHAGLLRVGGHSKGGNLAVYAAAMCAPDVQKRIMEVYTNDGPGQDETTVATEGYKRMESRIRAYIPQSSVVGMLLESSLNYFIVRSKAVGIMQHSPYTWQVVGADFDYAEKRTYSSIFLNDTIRGWLKDMSNEERRDFTDALFDMLSAGGDETFDELVRDWSTAPEWIAAMKETGPRNMDVVMKMMRKFVKAAGRQYDAEITQLGDRLSSAVGISRADGSDAADGGAGRDRKIILNINGREVDGRKIIPQLAELAKRVRNTEKMT